jgi:cytochrome b
MVLLVDEAQVEARFSPFGDCANLDARLVHALRQTYHRLRNHFGHTQCNYLVTWVMWNLILVCLVTVLVLVQDRCTVCAKHTIGSEIVLDAPEVTTR